MNEMIIEKGIIINDVETVLCKKKRTECCKD